MDTLQDYDSSDSDSGSPEEELENEIKDNSQSSNTVKQSGNTLNTGKSVKIPSNLIPRQLLNKKIEKQEKYYSEAYIAKSYALSKNKSSNNNNSLDLFGIGKINNDYKQKLDDNATDTFTPGRDFKDKVASIRTENDQGTEEILNSDINNDHNKTTRKRKMGDISNDQITEFNANEFYQKNNELIENGVLDSNKIIKENSKINYYSNNGKNQLSDIIKFTEKNYDKLNIKKSKK
ncbi:unnamed protein product [[Candida] boidinii]|uniref:Unnamed protein product n=1 Tax=Candida boidinii TaxID=5477 RepID=A0A9W6T1L8_CANBO|nr:hypothetical protein B5S30_g837 [[Candida] boidinii]GME73159.1 unnamed protein product [[Candida] boidinii]